MGLFGDIANAVLGGTSLAYEISKDQSLTGAEREANEFSRQMAQEQMRFQANETQLARDWQERMYTQYQSPSAMMRQYQEAGLNPALMYGGASGGSIPSASSPSGASASSVTPKGGDVVDAYIRLSKLAAEIDNVNADTRQKDTTSGLVSAQIESQEIANYVADATKDVAIETASSNLSKLDNEVNKLSAEIQELGFNVSTQEIRRSILLAEKELKTWQGEEVKSSSFMKSLEKKFYEEKGWSTPPSILVPIVSAGILGGSKLIESVVGKMFELKSLKLKPKTPLKTGQTTYKSRGTIRTEYHYE